MLKEFSFLYERNLFLLNDLDIEKVNNSFIESLNIKKFIPILLKLEFMRNNQEQLLFLEIVNFF